MHPRLAALTALTCALTAATLGVAAPASAEPRNVTLKQATAFYTEHAQTVVDTATQRGQALTMTLATRTPSGETTGQAVVNPSGTLYMKVNRGTTLISETTCPTSTTCWARTGNNEWRSQTAEGTRAVALGYVTRKIVVDNLPKNGQYQIDGDTLTYKFTHPTYGKVTGRLTFTADSVSSRMAVTADGQKKPSTTTSKTTLAAPQPVTVTPR